MIDLVYDSAEETEMLKALLGRYYRQMLVTIHRLVESGVGYSFTLSDAATTAMLQESASRVVRIEDYTRRALQEALVAGYEQGLSTDKIADSIDQLFTETWKSRPQTVARTELQHAMNQAAQDRYRASGVVDEMEIVDGVDHDDACRARNGKRVPVGTRVELNHPNCRLSLLPVLKEDAP